MSFLHSRVSLRRVLFAMTLTAALAVPLAMATPATADGPAPEASAGSASIAPVGGYSSIDSCSVSFSPSTFSAADTVLVTTNFGSTPGSYRIGADGLGPELASVLEEAAAPLSTANIVTPIPVTTVRMNWGLAPGTHSMDFYAVDGAGAAIGSPLCSATYNFVGEPEPIVFGSAGFADSFRVGEPVSATGNFTYTPTANARVTGCSVVSATRSVGGAGGQGGDGGRGGDGGVGGSFGGGIQLEFGPVGDGRIRTIMLGTGLEFIPATVAELESSWRCGRLSGTPTLPGTYTLTLGYYMCPSIVAPGSIPTAVTAGVDQQTYAATSTFTFVVEAVPTFTG